MGIERRMRLGEGPGSQVLLLCDGVGDRRDHGLVVLQGIEVVLVHQSGLAVADNGDDDGVEDDGHQTAGEAVVVQIHTGHRGAGVQYHRGVKKSGQNAEGPAEIAGDRGQSGAEQAGQLDGGIAERPVHHQPAQEHAGHDWNDVEGVLAKGREA